MPLLFSFTDAPHLGDVWDTNLDVDVLIHTRPLLIAERDRFAIYYGSSYAQTELQYFVISGLKAYGYHLLPSIYYMVSDFFLNFEPEAHNDRITASHAMKEFGTAAQNLAQAQADYTSLEQYLLKQTLDSPELIQQFVQGPLTQLAGLDPLERMTEIYRLRAAQFAENIPFSKNAPTILDRLFHTTDDNAFNTGFAIDTFSNVHKALIADIVAGLSERLEQNTEFLDQILADWVVPKLKERFPEIETEIERYRHLTPNNILERDDFTIRRKADPAWLALAKKLGSPVPKPVPPTSLESPHQH